MSTGVPVSAAIGADTTRQHYQAGDVEKQTHTPRDAIAEPRTSESSATRLLNEVLARGKVEGHGIVPLPVEDRTATRYFNVFTMWFSMNTNILA
jgi:hypothetical protein